MCSPAGSNVSPALALIGVHQTTTTVREIEGAAHLTTTRKFYEQQRVDTVAQTYLAAMGVGEPVMALMRKTPAASVRWLSLDELKASRLATLALDAAEPIVTRGANGLNGRAFGSGEPRADLTEASLATPVAGGAATVEVALRYRRGGGVVEAEATTGDLKRARGQAGRGGPEPDGERDSPGRCNCRLQAGPGRLIPRARFCDLVHDGATIAASGAGPAFPRSSFPRFAAAEALIAEACPEPQRGSARPLPHRPHVRPSGGPADAGGPAPVETRAAPPPPRPPSAIAAKGGPAAIGAARD